MKRRTLLQATVATVAVMLSMPAMADSMADAKAVVDKYASKVSAWDGPTSGPKAVKFENAACSFGLVPHELFVREPKNI